jgi:predicted alpha/beta hydrolase
LEILSHKLICSDGEHFHLSLSKPIDNDMSVNTQDPIILCLPAMGVPARKYLPLATALNKQGVISALFEFRGIDTSSVRASRNNNFGYHEILSIDLPEAIRFIKTHYPENPIYLLGHSLGGQLATLYMSLNPQQISWLAVSI